jgi:hypothetical protein
MDRDAWCRCMFSAVVLCVATAVGGCSIYLHDDALQKQTDNLLSTYKALDVPGALKNTLTAQQQFDKNILDSVVAEDAAIRDAELAGLLGGSIGARQQADSLLKKTTSRLQQLGGGYTFKAGDWVNLHETALIDQQQVTSDSSDVNLVAAQYKAAGGSGFSTCDKFAEPTGATTAVHGAAHNLKLACDNLLAAQQAVVDDTLPVKQVLSASPPGLLAKINAQVSQIDTLVKADNDAAAATAETLKDAKSKYDAATKDSKTVDATVTKAFSDFNADLQMADKAAGDVGAADYKPSALLATIRFKKTNICDVIAASANTSCTGGNAAAAATDANKALIGLLAGVAKVANFDQPPGTAILSVALAYQTALEAVAQAQINALQQRKSLLENEQAALSQEVGLLLQARTALQDKEMQKGLDTKSCQVGSLGELLQIKSCGARDKVAEALTAYILSWARGRTGARIDETRISQLNTTQALQVAQANATARDAVITTALTEIDNFGQGGVSAQTIASFLQAAGIAAIAKGVN